MVMQPAEREASEDRSARLAAGDCETMPHVGRGLSARERANVPAQRHALVQLHEIRMQQHRAQLRLPHQNDA